jgi:hypothetical protein
MFWHAHFKNNFLKIKKYYFNVFLYEKHYEKQLQPHSRTIEIVDLSLSVSFGKS